MMRPATVILWETLIASFKGIVKALEVWLKASQKEAQAETKNDL